MKQSPESINQILPFGELMRSFATQSTLAKGEIKKVLRGRGVFLRSNEKDSLVPCLATLLLSPAEFEELNECQNTREDNPKKSSSRIDVKLDRPLIDCLPDVELLQEAVSSEHVNYELTKVPDFLFDRSLPNRVEIHYEIVRHDLAKSWCEVKNTFTGYLVLEKVEGDKLSITKSYSSSESEEVANVFQNVAVRHFKSIGIVDNNSELKKILFKDFDNKQRIQFFWRLTSKMDGIHFQFVDIQDMEFRPDESLSLPERIDWMTKKKELILKGSEIHNTFFISEDTYHPYLQFWGLEAKFNFNFNGQKGTCTVNFLFKDFISDGENAEFEINISSLSCESSIFQREKNDLKQVLLDLLEQRKNTIYESFFSQHLMIDTTTATVKGVGTDTSVEA